MVQAETLSLPAWNLEFLCLPRSLSLPSPISHLILTDCCALIEVHLSPLLQTTRVTRLVAHRFGEEKGGEGTRRAFEWPCVPSRGMMHRDALALLADHLPPVPLRLANLLPTRFQVSLSCIASTLSLSLSSYLSLLLSLSIASTLTRQLLLSLSLSLSLALSLFPSLLHTPPTSSLLSLSLSLSLSLCLSLSLSFYLSFSLSLYIYMLWSYYLVQVWGF